MADRKITALTELTAPVATDVFPIIDVSEAANADKNKKIQLTTILKGIPSGSVSAPSVGFIDDSGLTGFFRVASNEIGISANQALIGSFTTTGFQLGSGTPAAQLHLFSTDTTDQVIIENTDTGADNAPDLVLFRNSASPAADDNLGNLVYRGEDSAGNTHDYASIVASIEDTTNTSEDGILDIMTSAAGTLASRIRLKNNKVGIGENDPIYPMHLTTTLTGQALQLQCDADDAASGANLMLYHRRGASGAGQDNDVISTIFYRGKNDNGTPEEVDFAGIEGVITDASDGTEDGKLNLQVMTAGTLTTKLAVDATGISVTGTVTDNGATHNGDVTFNGDSAYITFDKSADDLEFRDSAGISFGNSKDLQIFHHNNQSIITTATSNRLLIKSDNDIEFTNQSDTHKLAVFKPSGAVELYHDNSKRCETSTDGLDFPDLSMVRMGDSNDLLIYHHPSNGSIISDTSSIKIITENFRVRNSGDSATSLSVVGTGAVELYHNGTKKAETSADGLNLPDNSKLQLGDSQDLQLYHDSNNSVIDSNTGNLYIQSANSLFIQGANNENVIKYVANGALELYHDGTKKAETSADGLDLPDNSKLQLGTGQDLQVFWDGSSGFVTNQGGGNLHINSDSLLLKNAANNESYIRAYNNAAVELYYDNAKKAETTSSGLTVTGTVTETSDIAFKSDIEPITNTLDKIQQITGYKYKLDNASINSMGVIAQDVEKVFPELVHGDEGSKTLQYSGLIGVLVEAVKDLSAKVKALESN